MSLTFYNTLSRREEVFEPVDAKNVLMYVCGPTVYDEPHLGHARAAVVFDVLFRLLRRDYGAEHVRYLRNYTDVDDKIIARANERGASIEAINEQYIKAYEDAVDALGCLRPTLSPRVTQVMPEIIAYIERLIAEGAAYANEGCVFFDVKAFPSYGKLSNRSPDEIATIHRVEVDPRKRAPLDFALWKAVKPGEPSWPSPWGPGRPGWHIECSVMATHFGRNTLDIHGGGLDLIFPHHENEIAQCEALTHQVFARYWVHNGFVQINAEKMSKSLGNFKTVNELLKIWPAECMRYFLLSAHYRTPLDFTVQGLAEAAKSVARLYAGFSLLEQMQPTATPAAAKQAAKLIDLSKLLQQAAADFDQALSGDLNTAKALAAGFEAVRELNRVLSPLRKTPPAEVANVVSAGLALREKFRGILGLCGADSSSFTQEWNAKTAALLKIDTAAIAEQVAARDQVRLAKDWAAADRMREQLAANGVILEDAETTTAWRIDPDFVAKQLGQVGA